MVPTIFWSVCRTEGVLIEHSEHLDPDGCLVQQREPRTDEDAAKAAEDTRPAQKNPVWRMGAALSRKKLKGEVYLLDKGLLMGAA